MSSPVKLRVMTGADIPAADAIRALAGWNQTVEDWQRFLATEPKGCFVALLDGAVVGTVTTTTYGTDLAWIGMMLVHPDHRGRGIGRALMERAIAYLNGRRVRCIKLDATPLGLPVYEKLGFKPEWTLSRWTTEGMTLPMKQLKYRVRPWRNADHKQIQQLDADAFGADRWRLLKRLTWAISRPLVGESPTGRILAHGMVRKGARAIYLGPVVATSLAAVGPLIKTLLFALPGKAVYWDIPDAQSGAIELAQRLGFAKQRTLTRMFLGENHCPGRPEMVFALAAPEVG